MSDPAAPAPAPPPVWRSEAGLPRPARLFEVDDRLTAKDALRRLRRGEHLLYRGDFHNARQLLGALGRRLRSKGPRSFAAQRQQTAEAHAVLNRLLVPLDGAYRVALRRGPDARAACEDVWGPPPFEGTLVSLRELLGLLGARQWREKGVEVPALGAKVHPHYGVFSPTRGEYPRLLERAPAPVGKRVLDVGCGTGVLGFVLLERGAREVVATDIDPRAVACALDNAQRLGLSDRFRAVEADLFTEGRFDLVVFNPPWIPEAAKTRMDRAVYDPGGQVLRRFLAGVRDHLSPGGEVWLLYSDLAEHLGLRPAGALEDAIGGAGFEVASRLDEAPTHPRSRDPDEPLHAARARERVSLYRLVPR